MIQDDPTPETTDGGIVLSAEQIMEMRATARDFGAPAEPQRVDRPDGHPGYAEQMEGAALMPPQVAAARQKLTMARAEGAPQPVIDHLQRELANVSGYRLREVPASSSPSNVDVRELVIADVMNFPTYGYGPRPLADRRLADAYESAVALAVALRSAIEAERASGADDVPEVPRVRNASVVVQDGIAWQLRDGAWHSLGIAEQLSEETRKAIEEHTGPLG